MFIILIFTLMRRGKGRRIFFQGWFPSLKTHREKENNCLSVPSLNLFFWLSISSLLSHASFSRQNFWVVKNSTKMLRKRGGGGKKIGSLSLLVFSSYSLIRKKFWPHKMWGHKLFIERNMNHMRRHELWFTLGTATPPKTISESVASRVMITTTHDHMP